MASTVSELDQLRQAKRQLTEQYIPEFLKNKYEFYSYGHAIEILQQAFPAELDDLYNTLDQFYLTRQDILEGGGNKSEIPKRIDSIMYPLGWREIRISGDLTVHRWQRNPGERLEENGDVTIYKYIDGHNINYVKGQVAFDLEWNSKDQTFDRDLLAMRTYFECGIIDVGIILTRSAELNPIFEYHGVKQKYGASTTWMGKLQYRLEGRRQGGVPILAIGILPGCIDGIKK